MASLLMSDSKNIRVMAGQKLILKNSSRLKPQCDSPRLWLIANIPRQYLGQGSI